MCAIRSLRSGKMSGIIERLTTKTISAQIIEHLNKNDTMRFSEIKKAMGNPNDNIITRELNNLIKMKPQLVLKSEDKKYSLNRNYPGLERLLLSLQIMPTDVKLYKAYLQVEKENHRLGFAVTVATEPTEGYTEALKDIFENSKIASKIEEIYYALKELKILCEAQNLNEINEDYDEKEKVREQRFDIYITSIERLEN